jgi:hypothetical protein
VGVLVTGGLQGKELGVPAAGSQEFGVGAVFDEGAVVHDEDPVGVDDVGQPVGNQDRGLRALPAAQRLEQGIFGSRVQG